MYIAGGNGAAFQHLKQEMEKEALELDTDKKQLQHDKDEIATFTQEIKREEQDILNKKGAIRKDQAEITRLEPRIRQILTHQQQEHMQLRNLEQEDAKRLKEQHGVKLPPHSNN